MAYQSKHTGDNIDKGINLALAMYPVGSIYLSVNNINPGTIFGGTWEQIQDRFLLAAGSTYTGGATGGTASHTHTSAAHTHTSAAHTHTTAGHTLTEAEMPNHFHPGLYWQDPGNMSYVVTLNGGTYGYKLSWSGQGGSTTAGAGRNEVSMMTGKIGGGGSHTHGNTGSTTPGNTGSTTPGNTGSSSSLPPYLAIYVWKRTA